MNQEKLMQVLYEPHLSEKSTLAADSANQHVFRVAVDADKRAIKRAVETLFEVKVEKVQVLNYRGKRKRFGTRPGRRVNWKKAVVRLAPGNDIKLMGEGS